DAGRRGPRFGEVARPRQGPGEVHAGRPDRRIGRGRLGHVQGPPARARGGDARRDHGADVFRDGAPRATGSWPRGGDTLTFGRRRTPMSRTKVPLAVAPAIGAIPQQSCNQAIMTAPVGSTLTLPANPPFIAANGGVSVISAFVLEPAGTPVADGTVVQFFTD